MYIWRMVGFIKILHCLVFENILQNRNTLLQVKVLFSKFLEKIFQIQSICFIDGF